MNQSINQSINVKKQAVSMVYCFFFHILYCVVDRGECTLLNAGQEGPSNCVRASICGIWGLQKLLKLLITR